MKNSTFRVRIIEAQRHLIVLFAHTSPNLTPRQRHALLNVGGAA